jgi:hypothetical protein
MSRAVDEVCAHARTGEFGRRFRSFELCVVVEVRKFTDELDDRILEYCLFLVSAFTVLAYCLHNRFITHEQHSGDFCKLEKSLHWQESRFACHVFSVYGRPWCLNE